MSLPTPATTRPPRSTRRRVLRSVTLPGAVVLLMLPVPAGGARAPGGAARVRQVVTVDQGSFVITRRGERIGREEFRIVRQPAGGGIEIVARALAAYGERRVAPALQSDSTGRPLRYQVEVRNGRTVLERLTGQLARGRFSTQAQLRQGEAAREYLVGDGTILVDTELFHQFHFLGMRRAAGAGEVTVLVPRASAQTTVRLTSDASERVTIGGEAVDARRLTVHGLPGGTRALWLDPAGRVLRVSVPDEGLLAERDEPPR